jgi:hypothetical protein
MVCEVHRYYVPSKMVVLVGGGGEDTFPKILCGNANAVRKTFIMLTFFHNERHVKLFPPFFFL